MAGDWIKVEAGTPEKPEVIAIAARLGISQAEAFLACFKLWRWADSQTTDGIANGVPEAFVDSLASAPGLALALAEVGWLQSRRTSEGSVQLVIPNFVQHMGQSAKKRARTSKRVATHRKRSCNAESVTTSSLLSSECTSSSKQKSPTRDEGPGEGGGDNSPAWLVREWLHSYGGVGRWSHEELGKFFQGLIDRGIDPADIRDRIKARDRPKTEPPWEFEERYWPRPKAANEAGFFDGLKEWARRGNGKT